jgi:hypothetical protein
MRVHILCMGIRESYKGHIAECALKRALFSFSYFVAILVLCFASAAQNPETLDMSEFKIGNIILRLDLVLGTGPSSDKKFKYPYAVAVDGQKRIYVSDRGNKRIQIYSSDGTFERTIGGARKEVIKLSYPKAIATSPEGKLFIGDIATRQPWLISIGEDWKLDQKLRIRYSATQIGFSKGYIILATKNRLTNANIFVIDHAGQLISEIDSYDENDLLYSSRVNATIEASGDILLTNEFSRRVRRLTATGDKIMEFSYPPLTKNYQEPQMGIIGNMRYDGIEQPICYDAASDKSGDVYLLVSADLQINEKCTLCLFDSSGRIKDKVEIPFLCSRLLIDHDGNFYFLSQMETGFLYRYKASKTGEFQ